MVQLIVEDVVNVFWATV